MKKYRRTFYKISALISIIAVAAGVFFYQPAQAVNYTFNQTDWSAGVTTGNAAHPANQTGWNYYSSASSSVKTSVSGEVSLNYQSTSSTQTSDSDFSGGTFSSTTITGSGSAASVVLENAVGFSVINNPSAISDTAEGVAIDNNYIYAVGHDNNTQNWRVEKRNLSNGTLVTGFDGDGAVQFSSSFDADIAYSVAVNANYLYVVGLDGINGTRWVVEKRNISDGSLVSGFGSNGRVFTDTSSTEYDIAYDIAIDGSYAYVVGKDYSGGDRWRIEKRNLSNGSSVFAVTTDNSSGPSLVESANAIAINSSEMYVVGKYTDSVNLDVEWRIEKRLLSNGSLSQAINEAPTAGNDGAFNVAIDSSYMYIVGYDSTGGDQWRIEKRQLFNLGLVTSFDGDGIVVNNPSAGSDIANSIAIDADYMYVGGYDSVGTDARWRVEKRNLSNGALVSSFGSSGVLTLDPTSGSDSVGEIAADSDFIYIVGYDSTGSNQWRIEKRRKTDGGLSGIYKSSGDFANTIDTGQTSDFTNLAFTPTDQSAEPLNSWGTITSAPATVSNGGSLVYPGSGDYIYALRGNNTAIFWRYSISGNTWAARTSTPTAVSSGGSLVYPGSGNYIYALAGNNTTSFMRYSISGNTWAARASTIAAVDWGGSLVYPVSGDYIYALQGNGTSNFWRYSISGNTWTARAPTGYAVGRGGSLTYPGSGDYIYALMGNLATTFSRYSITGNSWETRSSAPSSVYGGGSLVYPVSGDYIYALRGDGLGGPGTVDFWRYDYKSKSLKFQLAASNSAGGPWNYVGPDGTASTYFTSSGTAIPSSLDNNRYIRYKAYFSTNDTAITPQLDDITVNWQSYPANQIITSSAYNSTDNGNKVNKIQWTENLPANTDIKFQIRTAPDAGGVPGVWSSWLGPTGGGDYYTDPVGGETINASHRDGLADQWFQYQAFLSSSGAYTPTLSDITITYVYTAPVGAETGELISSVYDTQVVGGSAINMIMWEGNQPSGTVVKFQIASSNNSTGPWNYKGTDGSSSSYYIPVGPGSPVKVNLSYHNNQRYFRYKIFLESDTSRTASPSVQDIIINWSP